MSAFPRISAHSLGQSIKQSPLPPPPLPSPITFFIVRVQGKPVSIATILITLCVKRTMELRYA